MRTTIIATFAALVLATPLVAQSGSGGNLLMAYMDTPSADAVVSRQQLVIQGWAFNCHRGGQQPHSVKVQAFTTAGPVTIAVRRYGAIYRPDVKAAFASTCHEMSSFTGFALVPTDWNAIPLGTVTLVVEWADSNGAVYLQQRITLE